MRKILSICFMLATATIANAQLVNSLNFSTGYDNVSGTTIPVGSQDPNWQVTALTAPFTPAGIIPYDSYTQTPWNLGGGSPVIPAGTEWISYDAIGMTLSAPPDVPGTGSMTMQYTFETCEDDMISFNATMRSDNRISAVRVDGVTTPFSQPTFVFTNWTTGSAFSYSVALAAGVHTVEVDILNAPSGNNTNPSGLNVDGFITSVNNSIIDRDNFPDYICCNAHFNYCMSSRNPYWVDFTVEDPSQPGTWDWFVNGMPIGSGINMSYVFPGPGTYQVCLFHFNPDTGSECEQCITICIADNPRNPGGDKRQAKSGLGVNATNDATLDLARIYPNPTKAEVNIDLTMEADAIVGFEVYNIMGKVVKEENRNLSKGQNKISLSVNDLPAGVYSLRISDGKTIINEKVQIEK